jgi:hypothetical protein
MRRLVAHLLTSLYPRQWRERYGTEFETFLLAEPSDARKAADVAWSALGEHIHPTRGGKMNPHTHSFGVIVRQPSAFVPMVMSLIALSLVLGHVAVFGAAREADEGATAHLWQLLMAGQLPVLAFFAIKWLPKAPRQALYVLAMQTGAVLASMAPVFFLNL